MGRERGVTQDQEGEVYPMYNGKRGRLSALVTSCVGTAFSTRYCRKDRRKDIRERKTRKKK
jgi:hypothetical protein